MNEEQLKGKDFMDQSIPPSNEIDAALRPPSFADFTGQKKTLERLEVIVGAACTTIGPNEVDLGADHTVACHIYKEVAECTDH